MGDISTIVKARWANPEYRARLLPKVRASAEKARAAQMLAPDTLQDFLRDYTLPSGRRRRRYKYSLGDLAKRYLLCENSVWRIAKRHGLRRNAPKVSADHQTREAA